MRKRLARGTDWEGASLNMSVDLQVDMKYEVGMEAGT